MLKPYSFVINTSTRSVIRSLHSRGGAGQRSYARRWDLPRLLAIWPDDVKDDLVSRERILEKLERALRAERQRGVAGHWTYDLSRHAQLVTAYRAERAEVADLRRSERRRAVAARAVC